MKVLQVVPYFSPYLGGQEKYVYNLSKNLVKMGHKVHVITSNFPKTKNFEKIDGVTVERHNVLVRFLRNPITPNFFKIKKMIKDFDVIHVHNEHSFSTVVTAYLKSKHNFPLILTNHGQLKFGSFFADLFENIYNQSVGKNIFRVTDTIVALSPSDAKYISSFGVESEKISILPNAIDISDFVPYIKTNNNDFLKKYNIERKQIILFVGQIIPRKGIEYLINAVRLVIKASPENDIIFLVVGEGEFLEKAKEIVRNLNIHDFVVFTGEIPFSELVQAYKSANVFILPSLSEGLPTTILEAMYFGLPVIATDIPGIRDHFKDVALLIPPKNENKLAEAIVKVLDDKKSAERLSLTGTKLVKSRYTWDIVAKKYEEIYRGIAR
jgi:glycosyltransferase involved in cell wall biosynthesis